MDRLVTTEWIINIMNALATEEREVDQGDRTGAEENQAGVPGQTQAEIQTENPVVNQEEIQDENPEEGLEAIQEETSEEIAEEIQDESAEEQEIQPKVTTRSGREIIRPSRYAAVTKVSQKEWKQEQATKAIKKELSQIFEELVAIVPIKCPDIPPNATILNSHMFLVNKYNADGEFEKVKARLVADGRDQDPAMYLDKSSPTVAIHSVFTVLGMAGEKRWRVVVKIDNKGAFVQTPMTGRPIYMRLDPKVVRYAKEIYPELDEFQWKDDCLYTIMLKAMYGCVQASVLWYALIRYELEKIGYQVSKTDRCVFTKQVGEKIFTLLLHVDDILALVDAEEAKMLEANLKRRFGEVQFKVGEALSYLGMKIIIRDEGTTVDMSFYVAQILENESRSCGIADNEGNIQRR
jgi:hypothetical protein